jgi:hypothetical protein
MTQFNRDLLLGSSRCHVTGGDCDVAKIGELLDAVFLVQSMLRLYKGVSIELVVS